MLLEQLLETVLADLITKKVVYLRTTNKKHNVFICLTNDKSNDDLFEMTIVNHSTVWMMGMKGYIATIEKLHLADPRLSAKIKANVIMALQSRQDEIQ